MSTQLNTKNHLMTGGPIGDVVSLTSPTRTLRIATRSEGWFQVPVYSETEDRVVPSVPVATPAPAAGNEAADGWKHLKANEPWTLPQLPAGSYYQDVILWEIGTDEVDIDGTDPGYGR